MVVRNHETWTHYFDLQKCCKLVQLIVKTHMTLLQEGSAELHLYQTIFC